jgi:hypothetical protein
LAPEYNTGTAGGSKFKVRSFEVVSCNFELRTLNLKR